MTFFAVIRNSHRAKSDISFSATVRRPAVLLGNSLFSGAKVDRIERFAIICDLWSSCMSCFSTAENVVARDSNRPLSTAGGGFRRSPGRSMELGQR